MWMKSCLGLDNTGKLAKPEDRFQVVLQKALPKLREVLSDQALAQAMARATGLNVPLASLLINTYLKIGFDNIGKIFKDTKFVTDDASINVNASHYPAQFKAMEFLRKAALLCKAIKLDDHWSS